MTLRIAGYDDTLRYTLPVEMTEDEFSRLKFVGKVFY